MKIVMVVPNLRVGGLETMVLHLCRGLKARGAEPVVFAFDCSRANGDFIEAIDGSSQGSLLPSFREAGIRVELFEKGPGFSLAVVKKLAQLLKQESADIVHSHDIGAMIYASLAKLLLRGRCTHIHTQHTLIHFSDAGRSWKNKIYDFCFSKRTQHLVAVSEAIEQHYQLIGQSIGSRRVSRIDNGVAFARTPVLRNEEMELSREKLTSSIVDPKVREKLHAARSQSWLLNVGRVQTNKGQLDLVELWNRTSDEFRSTHVLILVGPEAAPGEMAKLQEAIGWSASPEKIICVGATREPLSWVLASDIFVSASHHEGMPLAPLEAAGSGRPVLLSEIAGHRFLSSCGSFFELEHLSTAAEILEAKANEVKAAGEQGRARAWDQGADLRSKYGVERMTDAYLHLYARGGR